MFTPSILPYALMRQRIIEVALGAPHVPSVGCVASSWTRCPKSFTENGRPSRRNC